MHNNVDINSAPSLPFDDSLEYDDNSISSDGWYEYGIVDSTNESHVAATAQLQNSATNIPPLTVTNWQASNRSSQLNRNIILRKGVITDNAVLNTVDQQLVEQITRCFQNSTTTLLQIINCFQPIYFRLTSITRLNPNISFSPHLNTVRIFLNGGLVAFDVKQCSDNAMKALIPPTYRTNLHKKIVFVENITSILDYALTFTNHSSSILQMETDPTPEMPTIHSIHNARKTKHQPSDQFANKKSCQNHTFFSSQPPIHTTDTCPGLIDLDTSVKRPST